MILIKNIYVKNINNKSRLFYDIEEDNISKQVWFETESEYAKYLCYERCDAIVIGLLNYAMRKGQDNL